MFNNDHDNFNESMFENNAFLNQQILFDPII